MRYGWSLIFVFLSFAVNAASWQVCKLRVHVDQYLSTKQQIRATLIASVSERSAKCPAAGETLLFMPETSDYQQALPRKLWPKVGSIANLRYLYLDGFCKNDGNEAPCRIKHYPFPKTD